VRRSSSASLGLTALLVVLAFALAGCGSLTAALESPSAAPDPKPLAAVVPEQRGAPATRAVLRCRPGPI
jgi:hypothetical protein